MAKIIALLSLVCTLLTPYPGWCLASEVQPREIAPIKQLLEEAQRSIKKIDRKLKKDAGTRKIPKQKPPVTVTAAGTTPAQERNSKPAVAPSAPALVPQTVIPSQAQPEKKHAPVTKIADQKNSRKEQKARGTPCRVQTKRAETLKATARKAADKQVKIARSRAMEQALIDARRRFKPVTPAQKKKPAGRRKTKGVKKAQSCRIQIMEKTLDQLPDRHTPPETNTIILIDK